MALNLSTKLKKKLSRIETTNKLYSKIFLPKLYVNLWLTFRCNYNCSYCLVKEYINKYGKEILLEGWTKALLRLPKSTIAITGGEPFLYKGAAQLINNISKKHRIALTTNLSFPKELMKIKNKKDIFVCLSYQREMESLNDFAKKVKMIKKHFKKASINYVNINNEDTTKLRNFFEKKLGVIFNDDPEFYPTSERTGKPVLCTAGSTFIGIAPDGKAYACCGGFYNNKFYLGNIFNKNFKLLSKPVICDIKCVWDCDQDYTIRKKLKK